MLVFRIDVKDLEIGILVERLRNTRWRPPQMKMCTTQYFQYFYPGLQVLESYRSTNSDLIRQLSQPLQRHSSIQDEGYASPPIPKTGTWDTIMIPPQPQRLYRCRSLYLPNKNPNLYPSWPFSSTTQLQAQTHFFSRHQNQSKPLP